MSRYSDAYSNLINRLSEVDAITRLARQAGNLDPVPPNTMHVRALCRSGVVLLCSHIEGYIEDLATLAITRVAAKKMQKSTMSLGFRYHLSRDMIEDIGRAEDPEKIGQKIVGFVKRDVHLWDASAKFAGPLSADKFVRTFATPRHENIKQFLGRFGFQSFEHELAQNLASDYAPCKNMVDHVVDQRNKIAHGDFVTADAPSDLNDMAAFVKLYCRGTDKVVCDWFKNKGCIIR